MNQRITHTIFPPPCFLAESFTFSAKEKDAETGLSYFGARYYSSDLSIWLSVDPMSDKYPSLSPYVYCANNPIKLVDPNGEYLEVADDEDTHKDLLSIVGNTHRDRVIFNNDGSVSVNLDGLSEEAIKKDIGLSLIKDMVNSDYRYYYETSDDAFFCNESGKRVIRFITNEDFKGVINASRYGTDSNGKHSELPMEQFDGQVVIAKSGRFLLYGQDVRKNIVFHELEENFLRTDKQMNYQGGFGVGAHRTAARIENNAWGNFAGQGEYFPPVAPLAKSKECVMNYLNNGVYR
ncbi:MAG: RHS repeat-associated core domain-containing protein [Bacteroidales bacterium]|nr:RHS repeat-associated core domain-containing protein [Bacteroidales bacterium]